MNSNAIGVEGLVDAVDVRVDVALLIVMEGLYCDCVDPAASSAVYSSSVGYGRPSLLDAAVRSRSRSVPLISLAAVACSVLFELLKSVLSQRSLTSAEENHVHGMHVCDCALWWAKHSIRSMIFKYNIYFKIYVIYVYFKITLF